MGRAFAVEIFKPEPKPKDANFKWLVEVLHKNLGEGNLLVGYLTPKAEDGLIMAIYSPPGYDNIICMSHVPEREQEMMVPVNMEKKIHDKFRCPCEKCAPVGKLVSKSTLKRHNPPQS